MKKLLLMASLCLYFNSQAQTWCTPGSVWHFADYFVAGSGYKKMEYRGDTLLGGFTCNKLAVSRIGFGSMGAYSSGFMLYTRSSNNLVFLRDGVTLNFDTLYNFNASIGDKWRVAPTSMSACAASYVTVQDTGHRVIQGQSLKWYTVNYTLGATVVSAVQNDTVFERLGAVSLFPYLSNNVCATYYDAEIGGPLRCFSDHQISGYKRNYSGPCDYMYLSVSEYSAREQVIRLYPNPTGGVLHVSIAGMPLEGNLMLEVKDLLGRQIKSFALDPLLSDQQLDLRELRAGMYVVVMRQGQRLIHTARVTKQD